MATIGERQSTARGSRRWRWTSEQYHRLANEGYFGDRKVELLRGDLYLSTTNAPHELAVYLATRVLEAIFGVGYMVRSQLSLNLGDRYQPLPDVAIVEGDPRRDYGRNHPTTALLIVEVSDSSLRTDRTIKSHRYAQAGVADYWIVNLIDRQLEVYRNPGPDPERKGRFRYADVTIVPADGHAAPLARPDIQIAVADLLP